MHSCVEIEGVKRHPVYYFDNVMLDKAYVIGGGYLPLKLGWVVVINRESDLRLIFRGKSKAATFDEAMSEVVRRWRLKG